MKCPDGSIKPECAENARTKAHGLFQIMPDNWAPWSEAAEEAFDHSSVNKGELLKFILETDIIRGRRAYEKSRLTMTRSHNMELLLDPPRYHRHQSMLEEARANKTVSEEEYLHLRNLVKIANEEWLARRSRITQDRARWGFPR